MLLPQSGRILILDDKIDQAIPLIQVLSKNKTPFTFHSGNTEELPITPYDDIRLVFLDIDLTEGINELAVKAQLIAVLNRLIKKATPYILAVWSTKENQYTNLLTDLFNNELASIQPIVKLSLMKRDFFRTNQETGNPELDPDVNTIPELNKRLEKAMASVDVIKVLIEWENIVSNSTSETIVNFTNLIEKNQFWNNNMKHILLKMAHAQLGKNLKNEKEDFALVAALKTMSSYLADRVESALNDSRSNLSNIKIKKEGLNHLMDIDGHLVNLFWEQLSTNVLKIDNIEKSRNTRIEKLRASNSIDEPIVAKFRSSYGTTSPKLNAELIITKKGRSVIRPGNVYYKKVIGSRKRKLLSTYFKDTRKKKDSNFELKDLSLFFFVEMECTPICDFSQKKWLRSRILPGVLYPASHHTKLNATDSLYEEIPPFLFNNNIMRLVFDYRLFKSINLEDDKNFPSEFLFRIKNEVLSDIQTRISSHISRLGITTIL